MRLEGFLQSQASPLQPAPGSMVKRKSSLASNEKFQVRFLVELLTGLRGET